MSATPPSPAGWLESLRRIGESSLALLRSRLELFTVEWQEEKLRLVGLLVWLAVAIAIGVAGIFIGLITLAFWLWNLAGYPGVIGLVAVALVAAGEMLRRLRKTIQTGPTPFAHTVAEFRKDGECLRNDN